LSVLLSLIDQMTWRNVSVPPAVGSIPACSRKATSREAASKSKFVAVTAPIDVIVNTPPARDIWNSEPSPAIPPKVLPAVRVISTPSGFVPFKNPMMSVERACGFVVPGIVGSVSTTEVMVLVSEKLTSGSSTTEAA
jgi:hypothetical protein